MRTWVGRRGLEKQPFCVLGGQWRLRTMNTINNTEEINPTIQKLSGAVTSGLRPAAGGGSCYYPDLVETFSAPNSLFNYLITIQLFHYYIVIKYVE